VYSQPSEDPHYDWSRARRPVASSYYGDVSPPASSGVDDNARAETGYGPGNVSPIQQEPELSSPFETPSPRVRSQIPVPRKVTPGSQSAYGRMRGTSDSERTRWDKYSGEPTTASTGQPGQVKPGDPIAAKPTGRLGQTQRKDSAPSAAENIIPVTEKALRFNKDPGLVVDTRPPWKGASGRHTIVQPVEDKPGQTIPIPRRTSKKMPSPSISPSSATPYATGTTGAESESETSQASVRRVPLIAAETDRPAVPQKDDGDTLPKRTASASSTAFKESGYPSPVSPRDDVVGGTTTASQSHVNAQQHDDTSNRYSIPRKSVDTVYARQGSREHSDSRFSWTTYNTDNTYQQSPPPSPPPAVPALPRSAMPANPYSIMNRSRPVPSTTNSPSPAPSPTIGTYRRPVAPPDYDVPRRSPSSSVAPSTTSKALPRTPLESSASDLVDALQAQLDDLFTQRSNVQKVIREFLQTQPQNPLISDLRAMREAERKLQSLKDDLAEITRQEHDVGLRLHRANKKREKADGATPTALWIKRVTS